MKRTAFIIFLLFVMVASHAQVSEIKSASGSASRSSGRSEGGSRSSSGLLSYFFVDLMLNGVVEWQRYALSKRTVNPSLVSLELIGQAAAQPSSYYVFHPRVRATWVLFSTDFRVNYLLEEDINGNQDLTTFDWQVLQINLITARHAIGRIGFGVMKENFGENRSVPESSYGIQWYTNQRKVNGVVEYRSARDWNIDVNSRREFNAFVEHRIWTKGSAHMYATAGFTYQQYYESVNVWGIQGGLIIKLH